MEESDGSKYRITEKKTGFVVEGEGRGRVDVDLVAPGAFILHREEVTQNKRAYTIGSHLIFGSTFGLFQYYDLSAAIAGALMESWTPPARTDKKSNKDWTPLWLEKWARQQTAKAIGKRVHAQWRRLVAAADPLARDVNRAIYRATTRSAPIAQSGELYRAAYVVRDICQYRAAACAALQVDELTRRNWENKIITSPELRAAEALVKRYGYELRITGAGKAPSDDVAKVAALTDWRSLFSPMGEDYRSLNRTLANLPGGVPARLLVNLLNVQLERPVTDRAELILNLAAAQIDAPRRNNWHVFHYATRAQIAEALDRVGRYTHNEMKIRRSRDIIHLAQFLGDYPEAHRGTLVGLAAKAITWHRNRNEEAIAQQLKELEGKPAALPPVALPTIPGVEFLDTPERIVEEGRLMDHCVATYARGAVCGEYYLFHVDHGAERATVEINYRGQLVQAQGPRDHTNTAARWGARVLRAWGAGFPAERNSPGIELGGEELPF